MGKEKANPPQLIRAWPSLLDIQFLTLLFWINIGVTMLSKILKSTLIMLMMLVAGISLTSCSTNQTPTTGGGLGPGSGSAPGPPLVTPSPKTGFEADLDYVRKGQYTYVWVFSRKDGQPLDKDDAAYLRKNAPQVVDWVTSDQGRKVIAGTNFDLARGNLELLKKRFVVDDYTG